MTQTKQVLHLYRRILRAGARFPSIKRAQVLEDIKQEFRDHKVGELPWMFVLWGGEGVSGMILIGNLCASAGWRVVRGGDQILLYATYKVRRS